MPLSFYKIPPLLDEGGGIRGEVKSGGGRLSNPRAELTSIDSRHRL